MKTILKPLVEFDNQAEFLVGTKLVKKVKKNGKTVFLEYKLVWANWDGPYRMLMRKIDKKSNKAEYGIIPQNLGLGKEIVNKSSFQRTLGKTLKGWFLITNG